MKKKLISLKGKAFVSHGKILFGDSFAYDSETNRLYKLVGANEWMPQSSFDKTPAVPSFVENIFIPDISYEPGEHVKRYTNARKRVAKAGTELHYAQCDLRQISSEDERFLQSPRKR